MPAKKCSFKTGIMCNTCWVLAWDQIKSKTASVFIHRILPQSWIYLTDSVLYQQTSSQCWINPHDWYRQGNTISLTSVLSQRARLIPTWQHNLIYLSVESMRKTDTDMATQSHLPQCWVNAQDWYRHGNTVLFTSVLSQRARLIPTGQHNLTYLSVEPTQTTLTESAVLSLSMSLQVRPIAARVDIDHSIIPPSTSFFLITPPPPLPLLSIHWC